jgi:murein DD-endopeptidase MepM/ murein hydrolase activator NlpD
MKKQYLYILIGLVIMALLINAFVNNKKTPESPQIIPENKEETKTTPAELAKAPLFHEPLAKALMRVTKKPFGIYITKKTSPVQPEKFSGFHTGVDFETTDEEQKIDVAIYVVCDGPLKTKKSATGYGGIAVQGCKIENKDVTVIYGHLRLSSVTTKLGAELKAGDKLGVLGTGFSSETSGERKHLHLGIHLGPGISILGYVQDKTALSQWLDATTYLN